MLKHIASKLLNAPGLQYVAIIIFTTLSLGLLVLPASLSQPIADDYFYFHNDDTKSILDTTKNHYTTINGRWAQVLLVSIVYKLFGEQATQVVPVIEILLLTIVTTCLTFLLLPDQTKRRALTAFALASLVTTASLYLLPSIFDTIFWLTSSTVYLCALIAMITVGVAYLLLASQKKLNPLTVALFGLFIIASQAFNETASVMLVLLFTIVLTLLTLNHITLGVNAKIITSIGLTSSVIGLLIVFFAPGTATRRAQSSNSIDILSLLSAPLNDFTYLLDIITSWRVLLIIMIGIAIYLFIPRISRKTKLNTGVIGILLSITPIYFNGLVTNYGVGGTPLRAYTIPIFLTVIGLSILVSLVLRYIIPTRSIWFTYIKRTALPILAIGSLVVTISTALPLVQAQVLRKSLIDYRTARIYEQVNKNSERITITPAPNLIVASEAVDLAYNTNQTEWFILSLQNYYKLRNKEMIIERQQPSGYCLNDQAPSQFGIHICSDATYTQ